VLVAISIPIFIAQLEKSREATDAANVRSAYAEASADLLTNDASTFSKHVDAKQTKPGWEGGSGPEINGEELAASTKGWTVAADTTNNKVTITADS